MRSSILELLEDGPKTLSQLADNIDTSKGSIASCLNRLRQEEVVTNFEHKWQLKEEGKSGITSRTDMLIKLLDANPNGLTREEIRTKLNWDHNKLNQAVRSIRSKGLTVKEKLSF